MEEEKWEIIDEKQKKRSTKKTKKKTDMNRKRSCFHLDVRIGEEFVLSKNLYDLNVNVAGREKHRQFYDSIFAV